MENAYLPTGTDHRPCTYVSARVEGDGMVMHDRVEVSLCVKAVPYFLDVAGDGCGGRRCRSWG